MKTLQFKCFLLTDIIINQKTSTEGNQATLDFIPGNNFLGIVASQIYDTLSAKEAWLLFHSGKVRFGDAHPALDNLRTVRVPAAMFYPKLKKASELCFIHHYYDREKDCNQNGHPYQLKQCRDGFYAFKDQRGIKVDVQKTFAIKSAYDRITRRSKDSQMYGYQSIDRELTLLFEVAMDDDVADYAPTITQALVGKKSVGRSRTAQYGLVTITSEAYQETSSQATEGEFTSIYADGRLIFLDDNGLPTYRPTPEQLGVDGKIVWEKSQVRTFQYAPWNFKRQSRDTDRCCIEKGSVFIVKEVKNISSASQYVGSYQNEGFGKVIYNPAFLKADVSENGRALYALIDEDSGTSTSRTSTPLIQGNPLIDYLHREKDKEIKTERVYKMVNKFVEENFHDFLDEEFASQWGTIRSIAMQYRNENDLEIELFTKKRLNARKAKEEDDAYLTHGIAKEKWAERGRKNKLLLFFQSIDAGYKQIAMINLAAEMAKKCKRKQL